MKILQKILALSLCLGAVGSALAQSYTVRLPVTLATHTPMTSAFDFGSVVVGTQPQKVFTFTNRSASPTTLGAIQAIGKAKVFSHNCIGVLASNASCQLTMGDVVDVTGANQGSVTVSHSQSTVPDVYNLSATGTVAGAGLRFDESLVNFGNQSLRMDSDIRTLTLRNKGTLTAEVSSVAFSRSTPNFVIVDNTCEGTLAVNQSCTLQVKFVPQSLNSLSATVALTLDTGDVINAAVVTGTGVQGVVSWSASQVNFVDVPVGQVSSIQPVVLSNTGTGPLGISSLGLSSSDAATYFQITSMTCPSVLPAGMSCLVNLTFSAPDTNQHTAVLELTAAGVSTAVSRVQLFGRPAMVKPVLEVTPGALSFGDVPVGTNQVQSLTLKSIGQAAVSVTSYAITGAGSADYSLVNSSACIGTLAPGLQCVLQVKAATTAAGARTAVLAVTSSSTDAVPTIPLSANGILGNLETSRGAVSFDPTQIGNTDPELLTLTNTGTAALKVNSLTFSGAVASRFTTSADCTGVTLAPSASCTVTLSFTPLVVGTHSVALVIANTGKNASVTVPLDAVGKAAPVPVAALSDFTCASPALKGASTTCTATLTNPGTVSFTFSAPGTVAPASFTPAITGCTSPLAPGLSCTVGLTITPAAETTYSSTYTLVTSAQTLTKPVSVQAQAPHALLTMTPNGTVTVGQTADVSHVLFNSGSFPVALTVPPVVTSTPTGLFSLVSHTCPSTLAVGQACSIVTRCAPVAAGTFAGMLNVASNALPAISGTLTCAAQMAPPSNAQWSMTPSPLNFGSMKVGTSAALVLTVKNTNAVGALGMSIYDMRIVGGNASSFTVTKAPCIKMLASGASCQVTVIATPSAKGVLTGAVELVTSGSGTAPQAPLTVTGVDSAFTVAPTSLDFGSLMAGTTTAAVKMVSATNVGPVSGSVTVTTTGLNPAFTATNYCNSLSIAAGGSCQIQVGVSGTASAALRGVQTGTFTMTFSNGQPAQTISIQANFTAPPVPAGTLALSCPASAFVGASFNCLLRVSSTGTGPLAVSGLTTKLSTVSYPVAASYSALSCTGTGDSLARISVGQSCVATLPFFSLAMGDLGVTAGAGSSVVIDSVTASVKIQGPSVSLNTTNHADTQIRTSSVATHVLTNTGLGGDTISTVVSSSPLVTVNRAACTALASGQSCNIVTTCTPLVAGPIDATLSVYGTPVAGLAATLQATAHVLCNGAAPRISAAYEPNQTTTAGAFSNSGSWVRLTNAGVGPVTLTTFTPAVGWALYGSATSAAQCSVNKVLAAGASCLLVEALNGTQAAGVTVNGTQMVRTTAGDITWTSTPIRMLGLRVAAVTPFAPIQVGDDKQAVYSVTNDAPVPSAPVSFVVGGAGFSVLSNTCGTSLAANATCQVTVRYVAGQVAGNITGALYVYTGFDSLISGQRQTGTARSALHVTVPIQFSLQAANVTLTAGAFPLIHVGETTDVTSWLSNDGVSSVKVTLAPVVSGAQHTVIGGNCTANSVLAPGQKCSVITRFAPTTAQQYPATLIAYTAVGTRTASLMGRVVAATDVQVALSGTTQALINSSGAYNLTVTNTVMGPARVNLSLGATNSGGAQAFLSKFEGNICGTFTFNSAGAVISQTAATASVAGGSTCTARIASGQLELIIPAARNYTAHLTVDTGPARGSVSLAASAAVSDVDDTVASNNQATVVTTISYPLADLSVSLSAPATTVSTGSSATATLTVRNLTTGLMAAVGTNAQVAVSGASLSGGATVTPTSVVCGAVSAGAQCNASGAIYLPAGGSVTYSVPYATGASIGTADLNASVAGTSDNVSDLNMANNSTVVHFTLAQLPTQKRCMFSSFTQELYTGAYASNGQACTMGFSTTLSALDWMLPYLTDGATTKSQYFGCINQTVSYQLWDANYITWKNRPEKVTRIVTNDNFSLAYVPIAQVYSQGQWKDDPWSWYARNGKSGPFASSIFRCDIDGAATDCTGKVGRVVRAAWYYGPQSTRWSTGGANPTGHFVSSGTAKDGSQWRQTWIENSPGPNCVAPGSVRLDGPQPWAPEYGTWSLTN